MLETMDRLKHQEDSYSTHVSCFADWLATKIIENDARKALLLGSRGQPSARIGEPNNLHRPTVIVVDGEPHVAVTLSEILERRDYRTIWFTEPAAALGLMKVHRPDLLLTDVTMPILDEVELASSLKGMYPDCPVLMISALGDNPQLAARIAAAGISVSLEAKPMQISRLLSRIAQLLSLEG